MRGSRTSFFGGMLALLLLTPFEAISQGTKDCWVCLTKEEAFQASDSALYGQATARQVRVLFTQVLVYEEEVSKRDKLIATMASSDKKKSELIKQLDKEVELLNKRIKKLEKRPGKLWQAVKGVIYSGAGFFVGRTTSPLFR